MNIYIFAMGKSPLNVRVRHTRRRLRVQSDSDSDSDSDSGVVIGWVAGKEEPNNPSSDPVILWLFDTQPRAR